MKKLWVSVLFLCVGCASTANDPDDDENLKSGEVRQLAFTGTGNNLVVGSEFRFHGGREKCHCRLRSFSTADWKLSADTGELDVSDLDVAASAGDRWTAQARILNRIGRGNPYTRGFLFLTFNPATLERKDFDLVPQGHNDHPRKQSAIACAGEQPLCVVHLGEFVPAGLRLPPAFVFDLKAGKKTVELQDFPVGLPSQDDYFVRTLLEFTPDGKHIASSHPCTPYQIQLHAADTGKLVNSMKLKSAVGAIQFSPNGKLLAAVCRDGAVLILQPDLSKQIRALQVQPFKLEQYGPFPLPSRSWAMIISPFCRATPS